MSGRVEVFSRIAGHPALDLVNTVDWRLSAERRIEELIDYDQILAWALQFDLIDGEAPRRLADLARAHPVIAARERDRVIALREAVYAATFEGASPQFVADEYRDAVGCGELQLDGTGQVWRLPEDLSLPRHRIALLALDLLTTTDPSRFAQCDDADCGWVFLDTSPRRNRRWCVSADCGNRNRVREYYERTRAASGS
jgi:predicted RNA-binding Zn ribbon-like protein